MRGDIKGAANEFLKYTKAGGKVFKGLVTRRNDERVYFKGYRMTVAVAMTYDSLVENIQSYLERTDTATLEKIPLLLC